MSFTSIAFLIFLPVVWTAYWCLRRREWQNLLLVGASYGVLRLVAPLVAQKWGILILPPIMINTFGAYLFSMVITASTMVLFSLLAGWQPAGQQAAWSEQQASPWLRNSQLAIQQLQPVTAGKWQPAWLPRLLGWAVILLGCYLSFVVFW